MSNTTSIHDLPTDPTGGGTVNGNIQLVANEMKLPSITNSDPSPNNPSINLDQTTINQIISGLQQASSTGLTVLPSRDIPRNTENITQDPQIQPNFIPPSSNADYIEDDDSGENIIYNYNRYQKREDTLDSLYNEIQTPLLLVILYFTFQLPIFKNTLFKYIPALCNKDGNYNLSGYVFTSLLYGIVFYSISKIQSTF
uniref:Uncharacterized protein n=1 Tax=viral metagenome TaxID=1070528 RepID=A0A6C0E2C1_9ZZZZ